MIHDEHQHVNIVIVSMSARWHVIQYNDPESLAAQWVSDSTAFSWMEAVVALKLKTAKPLILAGQSISKLLDFLPLKL